MSRKRITMQMDDLYNFIGKSVKKFCEPSEIIRQKNKFIRPHKKNYLFSFHPFQFSQVAREVFLFCMFSIFHNGLEFVQHVGV